VRALELAGVRPIVELAELCGTTASAIALERQRQNPPPKPPRKQYRPRKQARKLQKLILLEPELYLAACSAARDLGHGNFCQFVRDALRSAIAAR
jgi:hypothetical protein